jgi:flagellar motor switch/type III secretory pathway protein FliN
MENLNLARLMEIPIQIEALVEGPRMSIRDLLALKAGSIVETRLAAGENVEVLAGHSPLGLGELTSSGSRIGVRMLRFQGEK